MTLERVQKIIAASGMCSRRKAEDLINMGVVKVNDVTITIGDKADASKDTISVKGEVIRQQKKVYLLVNKPRGVITTSDDMFDRETVLDLLPESFIEARVFPVGRLDRDAEGLLLLTNDGDWAQKIAHPSFETKKTYRAWLDKPFQKKSKDELEAGIKLDDGFVKDIKVEISPVGFVDITVHVGKHKVVKRLFQEVGYHVDKLRRIKIGKLELPPKLSPGDYRELNEQKRKLALTN